MKQWKAEDVLARLRYQPQPLTLPAAQPRSARRYFPALPIAAAIALIALGLGIWLRIQRQRISPPGTVAQKDSKPMDVVTPSPEPAKTPGERPTSNPGSNHRRMTLNNTTLAQNSNRHRPAPQREPRQEMTIEERAQAEAAKNQLMLALRVVSAKLNLAQRKAVPATGNTRFQHKVG